LLVAIGRDVDRIAAAAQVQVNFSTIAYRCTAAGATREVIGFVQCAIDFFDAAVNSRFTIAQNGSVA
jgi:hypothetical protein